MGDQVCPTRRLIARRLTKRTRALMAADTDSRGKARPRVVIEPRYSLTEVDDAR